MTYTSPFQQTAEYLRREIENHLFSAGLLCRVFGRGKSDASLNSKIKNGAGKYKIGEKLVQDAIGIRVVLYFTEDIQIVRDILNLKYKIDKQSTTIDLPSDDTFSVSRYNLIYRLSGEYSDDISRSAGSRPIDSSFEVQIRTVLSEGWHEVEHDLRYKCKSHWEGHQDLSRALNGVVATLETSEWTMKKLFDELAYRNYKSRNWSAMLHTKLRMRVSSHSLSEDLTGFLDKNTEVAKLYFRIDRNKIIQSLVKAGNILPVNLNNIAFLWNFLEIKNPDLILLGGEVLADIFEQDFSGI